MHKHHNALHLFVYTFMHEWYSSGLMWITLNCFPQVEHRKSLRSEWRSMWSRSLSGLQKALSHSVQWKIFSEWKLLTCFLTCTTQMHDWLITRIFPCNQTLKWPYHFWFSFFPWKSTYQRFISLKKNVKFSFYVFSFTSLAHQWILCSEWVPSEWVSKTTAKTSQ